MAGRYKGFISYEWDNKAEKKDCFIEVVQTASSIKLRSYFNKEKDPKTISQSLVEDIRKEPDGHFAVHFFYINEGSKKDGALDYHEGANKLRYLQGKKGEAAKLTGHYFTNRQTQTRGEMEANFVSMKLKGEF